MKDKKLDPCQKPACQLQECLAKQGFQESNCFYEMSKLVECCDLWKSESFKVCQGIKYKDSS